MSEATYRTFYRIVKTDPPTRDDFRSHAELGIPLLDPAKRNQWQGVSVYGTMHQARKKARQYPNKGTLIAELRLPESSPIRCERTGRGHSHYTLYGPVDELLRCVIAVWPTEGERPDERDL